MQRMMKSVAILFLCSLGGCTHAFGDRRFDVDGGQGDTAGSSDGGACNSPPANVCLDQTALRVQMAVGTNKDGACSYDHWDVLCENGCKNGACVGNDPCDGVMCTKPPVSACADASTLMTYSSSGTCSKGQCSYTGIHTACESGCASGACTGDLCAGVTCDSPPAPLCKDANTRRSYAIGTCGAGSCSYAPIDASCPSGCTSGACNSDPCSGVTCSQPPSSSCISSNTRRSYSSTGTCAGGVCSYAPTDTHCANGCAGGACSGDPCAGVTCSAPPAATCTNTTTLRVYASSGTCSGGTCSYSHTDSPCQYGCSDGACQAANPCSGITCNSPPAASCVNASTRRSYSSSGTCSAGNCSYSSSDQSCVCLGGACCFGCASGSACQAGTDNSACGVNGNSCVACAADQYCLSGACTPCVPKGGACTSAASCCGGRGGCNDYCYCAVEDQYCFWDFDCCQPYVCSGSSKCVPPGSP